MHDKYGQPIEVGDVVLIPATVKSLTGSADYCNVEVETTEPNFPGESKGTFHLNTKQCLKTKPGAAGVPQPLGETIGPGDKPPDELPPPSPGEDG